MSELTGSQKDAAVYVLSELFKINCARPDDKIAEQLAIAILSLKDCSKALALVPQTGGLPPGKVVEVLVGMAKQLRQHNVSFACFKGVKLRWYQTLRISCTK